MTHDERMDRIERLRSTSPPTSWRDIGEALGISGQWAHRLWSRVGSLPVAPETKAHKCMRCLAVWETSGKRLPDRCMACGSYGWRTRDRVRSLAQRAYASRHGRKHD